MQEAVDTFVERYEEYTIAQSFKPAYQADASNPCQLVTGGKTNGKFAGLSPKQAQAVEVLNNHISLPDVEVAVAQSDHASISIKGEKGQYH